jgi:hypothetical protein
MSGGTRQVVALLDGVDGARDGRGGYFGEQSLDVGAQARHRGAELIRARRRFTEPERNARRLALGILDPHAAGFDAQDAIGSVAELKDVAGEALDGEIFVERADEDAGGLENHLVIGVVGDGAAAGDGGEPRALARPQHVIHGVAM